MLFLIVDYRLALCLLWTLFNTAFSWCPIRTNSNRQKRGGRWGRAKLDISHGCHKCMIHKQICTQYLWQNLTDGNDLRKTTFAELKTWYLNMPNTMQPFSSYLFSCIIERLTLWKQIKRVNQIDTITSHTFPTNWASNWTQKSLFAPVWKTSMAYSIN